MASSHCSGPGPDVDPLSGAQVNEKTKKVCIPDGYAPPLAAYEAEVRSQPRAGQRAAF